jgi:hypothetical protein
MLGEMWKSLTGYLEKQPYWGRLQPIMLVVFLYAGATLLVYQYLQWQYGLAPPPEIFLRSYLFKQVTVIFVVVVAAIAALRLRRPSDEASPPDARAWFSRHRTWLAQRLLAVAFILVCGLLVLMWVTPSATVANVTLRFHPPERSLLRFDFDPLRLTYLVYELNREQRTWHLEVDLRPFDESLVTDASTIPCGSERRRLLCIAEAYNRESGRDDQPLILITHEGFGSDTTTRSYYWLHDKAVSVISATDWRFQAPSIYDYLAYSIVVHSLLIHLDTQCPGFRPPAGDDRTMQGDTFEPQVDRRLMQASVMASHLSRDLEEMLLNCFGPAYAADAARLLSLDWLRDDRVLENASSIIRQTTSSPTTPVPSAMPTSGT